MKFSIQDLFSKCEQIRSFLRIWPHLLKKSSMEKFIFCAVYIFLINSADVGTNEGTRLNTITSSYRLHQLIKDLTHIFPTSSSCIDLIFLNQHVNNVVNSSLHQTTALYSFYQNQYENLLLSLL